MSEQYFMPSSFHCQYSIPVHCEYPVINYLRAKMKGLMTEADLQRKDGSCETIGVIILLSPKAAVITT